MSLFDPVVRVCKYETVDFVVPERIREARKARGLERKEAAERLGINDRQLGLIENGHKRVTDKEFLFRLMKVYDMPRGFFYKVTWLRV